MRPLKLRLKGFIGIRDGLGLEEVIVDVSDLTGLIALVGDNGAGKTTLLDNLHPSRFMPSKTNGQYAPGAFSFYDEVYGRAEKELLFEMDEERWRSVLFIDPDSKKQEAYLYVEKAGQWKAINKSGKVSAYDKAIESLCGQPRLYFNSIYRCQEAPRLNTYRKGIIKDILADLLILDNIKEKGKTAKAVVDTLDQLMDRVKAQALVLEPEARRVSDLRTRLGLAEDALTVASKELIAAEAAEKAIKDRLDAVNVEIAQFKSVEESRKKTAERVVAATQLIRGICDKRTEMEGRFYEKYCAYAAKRSRLTRILANAHDIRAKVNEEAGLAKKKDLLDAAIRSTRDAIRQARKHAEDMAQLKDMLGPLQVTQARNVSVHQARIIALKAEISRIEESVKRLAGLPCPENMQSACPAVKATVDDKQRLHTVHKELTAMTAETGEDAAISKQIADIDARIAGLRDKAETKVHDDKLKRLEGELTKVGGSINDASRYTRLLPELETAEMSIAELEEDRSSALMTHIADLETSFQEEDEASDDLVDINGALADLDITLLDAREAGKRKVLVESELAAAGLGVGNCRMAQLDANGKVAGLTGSLDNAIKATARLETVSEKLAAIKKKRDLWAVIERGFGVDGIISLEIDDSGPEIARIANDLLSSSFGPQYSVRIDTQDMKADGKMAETFDITVITNDTGEEASISDKSGGQKTWLEDAITRSIALFNAERSGKRYHTLFTDERDGALSQDAKREFFIMKKKALEQGGFANEFFISHSSAAQDMCDHKLVFEKNVGIGIY